MSSSLISTEDVCRSSAEPESNTKIKSKRSSVFGKLKDRLLGSKKKRTRSHDSNKDTASDGESVNVNFSAEVAGDQAQHAGLTSTT